VNKPVLIIFTEGHPDVDTVFIAPELKIIHNSFEQIFVYPTRWENSTTDFDFPSNVIFSSGLSDYIKSQSSFKKKKAGVCSWLFWSSIFKTRPSKYKSLLNTCGHAKILAGWISKLQFDKYRTIFYSYWLLAPALALSNLKKSNRIQFLVSRAHGIDLYDERGDYTLNLFKPYIFQNLNKLYCVSEYGMKYLSKKFIKYSDKFAISRLGTLNRLKIPDVISDTFEIISCSFLAPVKRIELLILGLEKFQSKYPSVQIKWTHIGGGKLFDTYYELALQKLKTGTFYFTGTLTGSEIWSLYSTRKFACLVNVSESEGLPVSIMEAQSFCIPVIASAVGGTPEIVNDANGFLLSVNPTPDEITGAIYDVFINKEKWEKKRKFSRINWEENFNAEENYNAFAIELLSLV
jgi:glycosyltransferase involved in cell wall biosynthesis